MPTSLIRGKHIICKVDAAGHPVIVDDGAIFQRDGVIVEVGARTHADFRDAIVIRVHTLVKLGARLVLKYDLCRAGILENLQ